MLTQVIKNNYAFILEAEMFFLMKFRIDPFQLMSRITMLDLYLYIQILEGKIKKEQESINKSDLTKSLIALRDILMFMTMGKDGIRMKK